MPGNSYIKDNLVRISSTFTLSGVNTDPTVVKTYYKDPTNTLTTLTYGVDGALVKDSTGVYHVDVYANRTGSWFYRFESSGNLISASESSFFVLASQIL